LYKISEKTALIPKPYLPLWMIHQLEAEAQKQGISSQTFLENYLVENFSPVS
jgi:hypothetical protein